MNGNPQGIGTQRAVHNLLLSGGLALVLLGLMMAGLSVVWAHEIVPLEPRVM